MNKFVHWMLVIGLAFAPVVSSVPAEAVINHTWVASNGSDANDWRPPHSVRKLRRCIR
jgi:hypothetical protein